MSTTNGGLELMAQTQPQRYLTFNEVVWALDVLQRGVIDRDLATPPGSPAVGDAYIVDGTATGAWTGHENDIAFYFGGVWNFLEPEIAQGRGIYVQDEDLLVRWDPIGSPPAYEVLAVGDVTGPLSSVNANLAAWSGTGGDTLADSGVAPSTDATLAANSDAKLPTEKAVKGYVDGKVAGLSWKQAVRAATTAAVTLSTALENGDTLDGVTLATGDRVLVKNQASATENGIYTVNASGAPTRATDADAGSELVNATVYVSEGTALADTQWTCTTNAPITLGSTSLAFAQLSTGSGTVTSVDASGGVQTASGSAITTSGTIRGAHVINAQTGTSYALIASDRGKHVTQSNASASAYTIAQAGTTGFEDGYFTIVENIGVGALTLTPTTSTINGAATLVLNSGMGMTIFSDGTNYRAIVFERGGISVNAQTGTTYTYLSGDRKKLVTHTNGSAIAGTLPQATGAFGADWYTWVENRGAGTLTITPTTSTIDGAASLALTTNQGCLIVSDGTNYFTMRGVGGSGGGSAAFSYEWIPAGAMTPSVTGGCQSLTTIASAANQPDIQTLNFDATTQEFAQFSLAPPPGWTGGTITFAPVWSHAATTTNFGVVWQLQAVAVSNDDTIAVSYGTAQTSTDTGGTTDDKYDGPTSSAITIAGTPADGDLVFFRVARNPSDGSDTLAIDARLHGLRVFFS